MTVQPTQQHVRLRALTLVDEGIDEVLVGDPRSGTFVSVPAVGAVVIRAFQRNASLDEAQAEASRYVGEPVDVAAFVEGLRELGFLADEATEQTEKAVTVRRTAPIQQRRWVSGVDPRRARPLFSRIAWTVYGGALLFSVACFALRTDLVPRPGDVFFLHDRGLALLLLVPIGYLTSALHEAWHWLAARAEGLSARFGVDRRLCFLVFETDLSQLWTLPRRRRYGPQLAGLAIDSLWLGGAVGIQLLDQVGWYGIPTFAVHLAAAIAFMMTASMLWQCMVFLRTDLYGVLVTATGCHDLWNVKTLSLREFFGRLTPAQTERLAAARPRDVAVARWFRWVYLIGVPATWAYYAIFRVPILVGVITWAWGGLAAGPTTTHFWLTLITSAAVFLPLLLILATWLLDLHRRLRAGTTT